MIYILIMYMYVHYYVYVGNVGTYYKKNNKSIEKNFKLSILYKIVK